MVRLPKELKDVKKELTALAQYSRNCNLEIKGVPIKAEEKLGTTMQTISTCLNVEIKDSDIDVIHRVPTKNNTTTPNIIVKLTSRNVRDKILKKAKKQRLNTSHLGFDGEVTPIFINEHLCQANKVLLGLALKAKREKGWKFTWVSDGKILMRKSENSRVVHIMSTDDFAQIL